MTNETKPWTPPEGMVVEEVGPVECNGGWCRMVGHVSDHVRGAEPGEITLVLTSAVYRPCDAEGRWVS